SVPPIVVVTVMVSPTCGLVSLTVCVQVTWSPVPLVCADSADAPVASAALNDTANAAAPAEAAADLNVRAGMIGSHPFVIGTARIRGARRCFLGNDPEVEYSPNSGRKCKGMKAIDGIHPLDGHGKH